MEELKALKERAQRVEEVRHLLTAPAAVAGEGGAVL